jgi:predicted permease
MGRIAEWLRRFTYICHRRKIERDLEKEMQAHRDLMGDRRAFGNTLRLREEVRDVWGWNWLDAICRDMAYAARSLLKSPAFTVTGVLILTLGIGVNLAFFAIVNATLLPLGASAWRILSHLVTESAWIAVAGTVLGTYVGYWVLRVFAVHIGATSWLQWTPDWRTAAASLVFSVFAIVALGVVPAWKVLRKKQQLTDAIKDGGQQASAALGGTQLRQVLIGIQIACSCVLLVVAAALVRELQSDLADPGFDFSQIAVLNPHLDRFGTPSGEARSYWASVKAALSSMPQIESVSLTQAASLGNSFETSRFLDAPGVTVNIERTDAHFFKVTNIPILAGRPFADTDDFRTTVIISRRLAMKMYGSLDVIGRSFPKTKPERMIVGVAADAKLFLDRDGAIAYFPLNPDRVAGDALIARTRTNPATVIVSMMQIARTYNDKIQPDIHPMSKDFAQRTDGSKTLSLIGTSLASLAVVLACLGIFGLLMYSISLRTKEIGIRVALGAKRRSILMLVTSQLFWPMPLGILLGLVGGMAVVNVMQRQPTFLSPFLVAVVVFVFMAAAGLASLLPILRATRLDVLRALRYE